MINKQEKPTNIENDIFIKHTNIEKIEVTDDEIYGLLNTLENRFDDNMFSNFIDTTKKDILSNIVGPMGIGQFVAKFDKAGGNVDTIHNVRNKDFVDFDGTTYTDGVYATEKEKLVYDNRGEYDEKEKKRTHGGNKNYVDKRNQANKDKQQGKLSNDYKDNEILVNEDRPSIDHAVSTLEGFNDPGRVLAEVDNAELSNIAENLMVTSGSVNASKQAQTMSEYIEKIKEKRRKIAILESKAVLNEKQKLELAKLKRTSDADIEKLKEIDKKARQAQDSIINKRYYTSDKFIKNTLKTSTNEGFKMGTQQAIGILTYEFFDATFDEIYDIYKEGYANGFNDDEILVILRKRLNRIADRIKARWKDVLVAFKDGFISGFFSNIITVVINAFKTTGRRLVRMIREGILSLLKAIKLLVFPPENMTFAQASHEASKIIASSIILTGGIFLEEYIDKQIRLVPGLEIFADTITAIFVGALTGLLVALVVYGIDKLDLFGANRAEKYSFVINSLEQQMITDQKETDENMDKLSNMYIY